MHRWKLINDALSLGMAEPVETYSTSEHLYTELDIPREATGTLPRAMRDRAGLEAEAIEDIGETGRMRSPRTRRGSASQGSRRARVGTRRRRPRRFRPGAEELPRRGRRHRSAGRRGDQDPAAPPDQGGP